MRRYLIIFCSVFAALLALSVLSNAYVYFIRQEPEYGGLLRHQLAKLGQEKRLDTVFVGDSSLGNAIRAEVFDRLTGTTSANLALTGLYGYDGALNMLRRAAAAHDIRNAVIMQAVDAFQRPVTLDGYIFTAPDISVTYVPWQWRGVLVHRLAARLLDPRGAALSRMLASDQLDADLDRRTDYITQRGRLETRALEPGLTTEHLDFVMAILAFCHDRAINCVFAHGPMLSTLIGPSGAYIGVLNEQLHRAGVPLATSDVPAIPPEKIGDSREHVHPDYIAESTEIYARILRPHLRTRVAFQR